MKNDLKASDVLLTVLMLILFSISLIASYYDLSSASIGFLGLGGFVLGSLIVRMNQS